jgi:hypothetical protein
MALPDTCCIPLAAALLAGGCMADTTPRTGEAADGVDRCTLLSDDEVSAAIGPHRGGRAGGPGVQTQYGSASCRWVSRDAPHVFVELAMFGTQSAAWARDQAAGAVLPGAAAGMRYDETAAELWFECGRRLCSLQLYTPTGGDPARAQALAGRVEQRL